MVVTDDIQGELGNRRSVRLSYGGTDEALRRLTEGPTKTDRRYVNIGGDRGIRTPDLCDANAALSQLSYIPTGSL